MTEEGPEYDEAAFRHAQDQALASLAETIATYYRELEQRGVPKDVIVPLLADYQDFLVGGI